MDEDLNIQNKWYLVFTKVKAELKAKDNLIKQGYNSYLPVMQRKVRRKGKYVISTEPCFPRYLFVSLNTSTDNWGPIRSTLGVAGLVRFGGATAVVPDGLVADLMRQEDESGMQLVEEKPLQEGDKIEVVAGPFVGYMGKLQQLKSAERVAILLDIVGKNTQVTLSMHDVQIA